MNATIPGWSPEIERGFKEILFRFLEEVQCTRAALYLYGPGERFLLATQYGFGRRDPLAIEHAVADPLVVRARDQRGMAAAYNNKNELGVIAEYLKTAGNSRLLLVPLIAGDDLVGFVDARDKGRRRPFERTDVVAANAIAAAMIEFAGRSGFLVTGDEPEPVGAAEPAAHRPPQRETRPDESALPMLDDSGLENVHDAALDCLLEHQVLGVAVTLATGSEAATLIITREGGPAVERDAICRHQASALAEAGVAVPEGRAWKVELRRVPTSHDPAGSPMIASAVMLNGPQGGALVGSIVSGAGANAARATLARLRSRAEDAHEKTTLRLSRRWLARRLLQPGVRRFPDLVAHSEAVSRLSLAMAQQLELSPRDLEDAALAGLLHDVGMRELDYDRLYRSQSPSEDDRTRYQKHPLLGEEILRDTGLEPITAAVRHHHERWDGTGYPDRLAGDAIPMLARLVHVAEVFDVLSVPGRYRPTVSSERALEIIERGKGHQFDPQMVDALAKVLA